MKFFCENLNLDQIAKSGQTFRWKKIPNANNDTAYLIPAFGKNIIISQCENEFEISCSEQEFEEIWKSYFDLDTDYAAVGEKILSSNDEFLINAYNYGRGIRILRQDPWEMIVTFVISQNNNIPRITKSVEMLCEALSSDEAQSSSEKLSAMSASTHGIITASDCMPPFPKADPTPSNFFENTNLGLGYRVPYLEGIFEYTKVNPDWINNLKKLNYEDAMSELLRHKGIGNKVANCICLFGLHHVDAFPIDTHIKQILAEHYPNGFDFKRYEGVAGIVQQYMFYYKLNI